jgi:putative intracellular protease/amidase
MPCPESLAQGGERLEAGAPAERRPQLTELAGTRPLRGRDGTVGLRERSSSAVQEPPPRLGEPDLPTAANEQVGAELPLELSDRDAQRRLGHVKAGGRTGEVELLGDNDEVAQVTELEHRPKARYEIRLEEDAIGLGTGVSRDVRSNPVTGAIDILRPDEPKRVVIVASNPAVSERTGWPIGFWWAELTHPYWELTERGYRVDVASPDGGRLEGDSWSDPRDESRYSADDLLSLGFINSPEHLKLVEETKPLADIALDDYDAVLLVGGQGPMYTFWDDERTHRLVASFYEAGKVTAVICHATCVLLKVRLSDGRLLVDGKTWTGFANSEERFADEYVGRKIQPFWIEDEARKLENTNFIVNGRFKPHALRDGNLITGQQQYSGTAAARLIVEALGV